MPSGSLSFCSGVLGGAEHVVGPTGLRAQPVVDLLGQRGARQQQEEEAVVASQRIFKATCYGTSTVSPGCSNTFVPGALPATKAS